MVKLTVRINGNDTDVNVSEAYMGSPLLSELVRQAFFHACPAEWPLFQWDDYEVFDQGGNRLADGRIHRRTDVAEGNTVIVNKPVGIGA